METPFPSRRCDAHMQARGVSLRAGVPDIKQTIQHFMDEFRFMSLKQSEWECSVFKQSSIHFSSKGRDCCRHSFQC